MVCRLPPDVLNPRRSPRVPLRCRVEVRDRFAAWSAETEDVSPLGCQLVTPRLVAAGRTLRLDIRCTPLGRDVRAVGRVVWSKARSPVRLGVEFDAPRTDVGWFDQLLRVNPLLERAMRRAPARLPRASPLFLGVPPRNPVEASAEEVAVAARVGDGITVEALALSLGSAFARVRATLFSMLARRLLVLEQGQAVPASRWAGWLAEATRSLALQGIALPAPTPAGPRGAAGRAAAAQALYDEGIAHLGAGRVDLAVDRLREAKAMAPGNPLIAGALGRLAPGPPVERRPAERGQPGALLRPRGWTRGGE